MYGHQQTHVSYRCTAAQRHKIKLKPNIYNFFTAAIFSAKSFILFQVNFGLRIKLIIIKGITFIRMTAARCIL